MRHACLQLLKPTSSRHRETANRTVTHRFFFTIVSNTGGRCSADLRAAAKISQWHVQKAICRHVTWRT